MRSVVAWLVFSTGAVASASPCRSIGGADAILARGRVVLVGEIHGTREMPAVLVALACRARVLGLPVDLGFEMDPPAQAAIERYLKSGTAADRFAVIAPRVAYGDGTSSEAVLDMLAGLRELGPRRVFTFADGRTNRRYADAILRERRADAVTLVLVGATHAAMKRERGEDEDPAGLVLRTRGLDVRSIQIDFTRGAAYNLGPDGSRVHDEGVGTAPNMKPYVLERSRDSAYDLILSVGELHPSPPAEAP